MTFFPTNLKFGTLFAYIFVKDNELKEFKMAEHTDTDQREKEKWITPEIHEISGLDSCVEFLYGSGGDPMDGPPPFIKP